MAPGFNSLGRFCDVRKRLDPPFSRAGRRNRSLGSSFSWYTASASLAKET
jgi:hypothetical protein